MIGTAISFALEWGWVAGPVGMVASFFARSKVWLILGAVAGLAVVLVWGWVALERRAETIEAQKATLELKSKEVELERDRAREAAAVAQRNAEKVRELEAIAEGRRQEAELWSSRINDTLARHRADLRRTHALPGRTDALPPALDAVVDILRERAASRAVPGDRPRGSDGVRPAGRPAGPGAAAPAR